MFVECILEHTPHGIHPFAEIIANDAIFHINSVNQRPQGLYEFSVDELFANMCLEITSMKGQVVKRTCTEL